MTGIKNRQPKDLVEGSVHETKFNGMLVIKEYINIGNIIVEFISTGCRISASGKEIRKGTVKDRKKPSVFGQGYIGVGEYNSKSVAYSYWHSMLRRCYSTTYQKYRPTYIGCVVCEEWKNFQIFAEWFENNYPVDGKDHQLDKDLLAKTTRGKFYSPEYCSFLTAKENSEARASQEFIFLDPYGVKFATSNLSKFCAEHKLHTGMMSMVHSGKRARHKSWTKFIEDAVLS